MIIQKKTKMVPKFAYFPNPIVYYLCLIKFCIVNNHPSIIMVVNLNNSGKIIILVITLVIITAREEDNDRAAGYSDQGWHFLLYRRPGFDTMAPPSWVLSSKSCCGKKAFLRVSSCLHYLHNRPGGRQEDQSLTGR